ncbi:phycobilisome protein [Leptolyngbyaceae cyanobacterium CCMR0082]|uniref:Phycobilisome protein n=2 Tax=Adonisia turfae TaxID=2950184 RepID=A0A6M0S4U6_9CYAN|nr:phycobilisome protein [Adonisia turfae]EKV02010.1 Phycobilisome protein [Leptolyngbya sp. PCC 7375]MDV3350554.1 phycobilisome protein [Leptothoe sp. LEGE 181152]NEZ55613.1 phycobilisome protein [Adonisia turfae CCMR0081]NEZ63406.1 phycobilisome protein [Adonisia turfae CCMR0082]
MLSQLQTLVREVDGRYATDTELMFLQNYLQTARLRFSAYQKIQKAETAIIQQVKQKLKATDPQLLRRGKVDLSAKWQRDAVIGFRYCAHALLVADEEGLEERLLLWFQSIIRSFKAQQSCDITYKIMQDVVRQHLTPQEAELFCPILAQARLLLGQ